MFTWFFMLTFSKYHAQLGNYSENLNWNISEKTLKLWHFRKLLIFETDAKKLNWIQDMNLNIFCWSYKIIKLKIKLNFLEFVRIFKHPNIRIINDVPWMFESVAAWNWELVCYALNYLWTNFKLFFKCRWFQLYKVRFGFGSYFDFFFSKSLIYCMIICILNKFNVITIL